MEVVNRNQGADKAKWNHLPICMPYWNGGPWKGQPALFRPKEQAFARKDEPPQKPMKEAPEGKYEAEAGRVMF